MAVAAMLPRAVPARVVVDGTAFLRDQHTASRRALDCRVKPGNDA